MNLLLSLRSYSHFGSDLTCGSSLRNLSVLCGEKRSKSLTAEAQSAQRVEIRPPAPA